MKIRILSAMVLFAFVFLGVAGFAIAKDEIPSNTGTPQTGMYTPGGRTPQVPQTGLSATVGGQAPAGAIDQNTGAGDMYFDEKTYTWKHKK